MICINDMTVNPRFLHGLNNQKADPFEVFHPGQVLGQGTSFTRRKQAVHFLLLLALNHGVNGLIQQCGVHLHAPAIVGGFVEGLKHRGRDLAMKLKNPVFPLVEHDPDPLNMGFQFGVFEFCKH
jgi:small ligand-binding sensory domain FIST